MTRKDITWHSRKLCTIEGYKVLNVSIKSMEDLVRWILAVRDKQKLIIYCKIKEHNRQVFHKLLSIASFAADTKKRIEFKKTGYIHLGLSEDNLTALWFGSDKNIHLGYLDIEYADLE